MTNTGEYGWKSSEAPNSCSYIAPKVVSLLESEAPHQRGRLVELGAGNGALARILAERGFEVTAIEPSPDGIDRARRISSRATFLQASVYETLSSTAGTGFDFAVSTEVIEHLSRPKELFARAQELLKVSGTLILTTPYHGYLKNLALSVLDGWDAHFGVDWEGGHIKFFSNKTLTEMGRDYGFDRPRFLGVGRLPYLWKSTVMVVKRDR